MHTTANDLGLTDPTSGCSCSPAAHSEEKSVVVDGDAVTQDYFVTGMTCSHCVASVSEEISSIEGVATVQVDLQVGGESRVTVSSATPIDPAAVRAAVEEAGYTLVATD